MTEQRDTVQSHNCIAEIKLTWVENALYTSIRNAYDPEIIDNMNNDFYYDTYLPAIRTFKSFTDSMASSVWNNLNDYPSCLNEEKVARSVAKGLRAGYLWSKAELANA